MRSPLLGLWDIGLLWILILVTLILFWNVDRAAGLLLAPYLLWVSFASALNGTIYLLNR
jgi:tryptophan-rich sensory protein